MKVIDLPSEFETLQDYVMRENKEKIENISLDKGTKFNRCWMIKNARKNTRRIYGSIIKDNKETIISLEYMLLMKMNLMVSIYALNVLNGKLETSVEIYKLDEIEFNQTYKQEINELLLLYKRDR